MELLFKESARADVGAFVRHYEDAFLELYDDTGLWGESEIIESARANAKKLFTEIYAAAGAHLERTPVLGRKKIQSALYTLNFQVGRRLVIVYYSEDKKQNIRWVESISIDRKPIIF